MKLFKHSIPDFFLLPTIICMINSCTPETLTPFAPPVTDYYPLQTGKVLVYRLDSTTITAFGAALIVKSYHAKDSIASTFNDNTGRLSYLVYRFVTDTLETQPWQYLSTYYVTPTEQTIELLDDNNLRFLKLASPVRNDFNWQGNTYIDTRSATSPYQYMDGWNYTYQDVNTPYTTLMGSSDSAITIVQRDETSPEGPFDPQFYQQRNYSTEVYAKGIGLVYKEFLHWTWQTTPPPARYADDSYGVTLNLIEVR